MEGAPYSGVQARQDIVLAYGPDGRAHWVIAAVPDSVRGLQAMVGLV